MNMIDSLKYQCSLCLILCSITVASSWSILQAKYNHLGVGLIIFQLNAMLKQHECNKVQLFSQWAANAHSLSPLRMQLIEKLFNASALVVLFWSIYILRFYIIKYHYNIQATPVHSHRHCECNSACVIQFSESINSKHMQLLLFGQHHHQSPMLHTLGRISGSCFQWRQCHGLLSHNYSRLHLSSSLLRHLCCSDTRSSDSLNFVSRCCRHTERNPQLRWHCHNHSEYSVTCIRHSLATRLHYFWIKFDGCIIKDD